MKKLFILICIIAVSANTSFAAMGAYDAGTLNREYMQDMRLHEFQTRERNKAAIVQKENAVEKRLSNVPVSAEIKQISFDGNEALSSETLLKVVESNIGTIANEQRVVNMRNLLLKYYQSNGYYSVIVFPDITKLSSGELLFYIKEGGKNSVTIE